MFGIFCVIDNVGRGLGTFLAAGLGHPASQFPPSSILVFPQFLRMSSVFTVIPGRTQPHIQSPHFYSPPPVGRKLKHTATSQRLGDVARTVS